MKLHHLTMAGLDPATQPASVCERVTSFTRRQIPFAAQTRGCWVAGSGAGHGGGVVQ
jgi:hypothetical protein